MKVRASAISTAEEVFQPATFDPLESLDELLSDVGLSRAEAGATVSLAGQDPIVPAVHRLGACIGVPLMAGAVAAVAFHRHRGGPAQDLHLDLRQAVHTINPGAFWHPTLNGEVAPHPLVVDNPFLVTPYRTADGRWVMASGVYPHLAAKWCRFLDVPPDAARVAAAVATWDAFDLEEEASATGLPICVVRTPAEWLAHEQGALLAGQPVIGLERIGVQRHPGPVVHARCRWPHRGKDVRRARSGRPLCDPPQGLRARVHLCRSQRRFPERLCRPRRSGR